MKRLVIILILFAAALFASATKEPDADTVSTRAAASLSLNQEVQYGDAERLQHIEKTTDLKKSQLEKFLAVIDDQIRNMISLVNLQDRSRTQEHESFTHP